VDAIGCRGSCRVWVGDSIAVVMNCEGAEKQELKDERALQGGGAIAIGVNQQKGDRQI